MINDPYTLPALILLLCATLPAIARLWATEREKQRHPTPASTEGNDTTPASVAPTPPAAPGRPAARRQPQGDPTPIRGYNPPSGDTYPPRPRPSAAPPVAPEVRRSRRPASARSRHHHSPQTPTRHTTSLRHGHEHRTDPPLTPRRLPRNPRVGRAKAPGTPSRALYVRKTSQYADPSLIGEISKISPKPTNTKPTGARDPKE